ncbi:inter-alpha-trypsin inhibitor heavy chain H3-like [Apostichopus japonicus]|uniref:inter-alpha-trypsin inhibitor heavy chain H3-like n=1 Tax=Stichopus japonicus TaxID=307972 RepID=UPI003AB89800
MESLLRITLLYFLLSSTFGFGFSLTADAQVDVGVPAWILPITLNKLHVTSLITTRFVQNTVEAVYVNIGEETREVPFGFKITPHSYISAFSIDVDGVPYHADIIDKKIAQAAFANATRRKQSAGYARESGSPLKFQVDLDVAPGSTVTFHLTYDELLRSEDGEFTHRVHIAPGQIVEDLKVEAFLMETQGLKSLNAFWIPKTDDLESSIEKNFEEGMIKASVRFIPSAYEQRQVDPKHGINGVFVVKYDLVHRPLEGRIEINNGYFAHFISPEDLPPAPKKVVFVIDLSGSMVGDKLTQTKISLKAIFGQLREQDLFNLVLFSSQVQAWKAKPVPVTKETVQEVDIFVDALHASGGTDINNALLEAASEFDDDSSTFDAIIFMTDGVPSVGETSPDVILESVTNAIDGNAVLFCIGFGADVDEQLLYRLAVRNQGVYRRVTNDQHAASQLEGFFQEVASPLLYNVRVTYGEEAIPSETLTQNEFVSIFNGREIIIAGKISDDFNGPAVVGLLNANSADGLINVPVFQDIAEMPPMPNVVEDYTEKIWAHLMIKELLQQIQLETSPKLIESLRKEALQLSLQYHLVTPLSALLFYTPPDEDPRFPHALAARLPEPEELFTGRYHTAFSRVFGDPHFVIDLPNTNITICFDVHGEKGTIVNLLTDKRLDILVNAKMWPFTMNGDSSNSTTKNTFFNRIGVKLGHHRVTIAPLQVLVDSEVSYSWRKKRDIILGEYTVAIQAKGLVTISRGNDIVMNIQRLIWKDHPTHFDFFLVKGEGFSNRIHGIVGQFQRKALTIMDESRNSKTGKIQAKMNFGTKEEEEMEEEEKAYVYQRDKFSLRGYKCWWARSDVYLDGKTEQYIVPKLFDEMTDFF